MAQSFMSPVPLFTLDSLVALGRWTAVQPERRKANAKPKAVTQARVLRPSAKQVNS